MGTLSPMVWVALGGGLGAVCRFGLTALVDRGFVLLGLPMGTWVVNVVGCFVMGLLAVAGARVWGTAWGPFLVPGLLGGFTTYSAFNAQTLRLFQAGQMSLAFGYVAMTVVGGLGAGLVGLRLASAFLGR